MIQRRKPPGGRGRKRSRPARPKTYRVVCAGCGKVIMCQVPPPEDKALLCMDCFKK